MSQPWVLGRHSQVRHGIEFVVRSLAADAEQWSRCVIVMGPMSWPATRAWWDEKVGMGLKEAVVPNCRMRWVT
jgi:hypothetical protein